ncbi:hypothetical protein EXIGLDRAFT_717444 [Exidia glandulosa HHB12029]|uniref:Uncharacterized protein n=1 Tax=Exidia glandulosa HHB12029 TaxID=1314781 RepID=A0A165ICP1_EXIGL|nr:hypothetical protein EXIGLDRAFT_717444 [Exidia glandulosa HHB12029]
MALALAQHNAPNLPAEHPINRVNPTKIYRNCTLHGQGSMGALKYGLAGQLKGYVFHACTVVGCNTLYKYTPEPVPDQRVFIGAHGALPAGAFAHHGAAFPGPPPPVPVYHAAVPHLAMPPLPESGGRSATQSSSTVFCREGCRTSKGHPHKANGFCNSGPSPRCKPCCNTKLRALEEQGQAHNGCTVHKQPASPGLFQPDAPQSIPGAPPRVVDASSSSPPAPIPILLPDIDPARAHHPLQPPLPRPGTQRAQLPAAPAQSPSASQFASSAPITRAGTGASRAPLLPSSSTSRGGLVQSLDLSWQDIQRSQSATFFTAADARARAVATRTKDVMVVFWKENESDPFSSFMPIAPPFRFSLSADFAELLTHWNIRDRIVRRYRDSAWHDHVIDTVLDASSVQVFLFSVPGLVAYGQFSQYIALLQSGGPTNASTARPNLKRLGEQTVSPLGNKRLRLSAAGQAHTRAVSPSPQSRRSVSPLQHRATNHLPLPLPPPASPPPASAPLPSTYGSAAPPLNSSSDVALPTRSNEPIRVERDGMAFPGDFSVANVVNAIHDSYALSTKRRLAHEKSSGRMQVLSELLKTRVVSTTESNIRIYLLKVERQHPDIYRKFLAYGHAPYARITDLRLAVSEADQATIPASNASHPSPTSSEKSPPRRQSKQQQQQQLPLLPPAEPRAPSHSPEPVQEKQIRAGPVHFLPGFQELLASLGTETDCELEQRRRAVEKARHVLSKYRIPQQDELDWSVIAERIGSLDDFLAEVAQHPMAREHAQKLAAARRARTKRTATDEQLELAGSRSVKTAFFGPPLYGLILALTHRFRDRATYSPKALEAMRPLTVELYYEQVLVREIVLCLIELQLAIDTQEAVLVYDASNVIAELETKDNDNDIVTDSDDDMPRAPVATTAADFTFQAMAEKRRLELLQKGEFISFKEEPLDHILPAVPQFTETVVDGKTLIIIDDD